MAIGSLPSPSHICHLSVSSATGIYLRAPLILPTHNYPKGPSLICRGEAGIKERAFVPTLVYCIRKLIYWSKINYFARPWDRTSGKLSYLFRKAIVRSIFSATIEKWTALSFLLWDLSRHFIEPRSFTYPNHTLAELYLYYTQILLCPAIIDPYLLYIAISDAFILNT